MATSILPKPKRHPPIFIVSNTLDKPDPRARHLIRSHVMRGKNQRKRGSLPRLKSWINEEPNRLSQSSSVPVPSIPLPKQVGSGLSLPQTAFDMPPYALDLIFKFGNVLGQALYPIELCLTFSIQNSIYVEYLAIDALYCHSVLWMTQAYFDWRQGLLSSRIQLHHAHETLGLLQRRVREAPLENVISDTSICVVTMLVMMGALLGDLESAAKHFKGLFKMVELRGGVRVFEESQVQLKVCRADLTIALLTDTKPMFFSGGISWEPYIASVQSVSQHHRALPNQLSRLDAKLRNIWADLREFTRSANLAFQTGQRMDCVLFQEILISVQYRLLLLDSGSDTLNKALHSGTLAFATNIFLQIQGLEIQFGTLSTRLRDAIFGLHCDGDEEMVDFRLWLLFVAWLSILADNRDSWLLQEMRKMIEHMGLKSWKEGREKLKGFLWIDALHDERGKKAFQEAIASSLEISECSE